MMKRTFLLVLFVVTVCFSTAVAETIFVDTDSPNDPGSGVPGDPFRKIQDAIDDANDGDTVEIKPGIYTGQANRDLDPNGTAVTIRSTAPEDPNIVANTIIDCNNLGRAFYFHSGEDANCVVSGLTIENGYSASEVGYAGSFYCFHSSPTIQNCIIKNGDAIDSGGGIYCDFANPKIINCIIKGNTAGLYGGGISCYNSDPELVNCIISDNIAGGDGGAVDLLYSSPVLHNCIIKNNEANNSGGMNSLASDGIDLANCTIVGNNATNSGGAVTSQGGSSITIENSILWANDATQGTQLYLSGNGSSISVSYSDIEGGETEVYTDPCSILIWGSGNIDTDPCFAAFQSEDDPNLWDLHLQSAYGRWDANSQTWVNDVNTSSCIDTGDPNSDWSSEVWPNGKRINMGAFGGTNESSMYGNIADFDVDGIVDCNDLAEITTRWLTEQECIMDLKSDSRIDFADFALFADNWLWAKP